MFDVELIYLARRRGYRHGDRADPLVRQARVADAGAAALALRVAWDLFRIPLPAPRESPPRRRRRVMDRQAISRLARAALPVVAILSFVAGLGGIGATP